MTCFFVLTLAPNVRKPDFWLQAHKELNDNNHSGSSQAQTTAVVVLTTLWYGSPFG